MQRKCLVGSGRFGHELAGNVQNLGFAKSITEVPVQGNSAFEQPGSSDRVADPILQTA